MRFLLKSIWAAVGQGVVSRTLKTFQWLVLWAERNTDDVDKSTLFWKRMYKFETTHFHRRDRRSNVHRGIPARRNNVETYLCYRKMPGSTNETHDDSEVRTSSRSIRSSSQEADFEGKSIITRIHLQSYTGYKQRIRNNKFSLRTGQRKYWKTLPWINGDRSKVSKTLPTSEPEECPSKASRSPGG